MFRELRFIPCSCGYQMNPQRFGYAIIKSFLFSTFLFHSILVIDSCLLTTQGILHGTVPKTMN